MIPLKINWFIRIREKSDAPGQVVLLAFYGLSAFARRF